jgi:glutaredoxin
LKNSKRLEKIERRKDERDAREATLTRSRFLSKVSLFTGVPLLIVGFFLAWNAGWFGAPASEHPYAPFAQCLTDAGLTMYGADWCPHCQDQKAMFDDAFEFIDYVNCDFNKTECAQKVDGYPTWYYQDKFWEDGVQSFNDFAEVSGCTLPEGVDSTIEEVSSDGVVTVVEE